jgi:site-specific recombinase XerD
MAVRPKKDKTGAIVPGVWIIDYRPKGRKGSRLRREFGNPDEPRTESQALALEMELRRLSRREPVSLVNPKVSELLPDWKSDYRNHHEPSTVKDLEHCLVHLNSFFGTMYVAEIIPGVIEQYKTLRLEKVKKRTINKELSYLSGFLKWCFENGHSSHPVRVKLFPAKQTKAAAARPLHPKEVDALLSHLEEKYRLVFLLYNDAGLRRAEVLGGGEYKGLTTADIDLKFGLIYVRGKGNKERIVPITTQRLRQALKTRLDEGGSEWLCPNPKTKKPWYSIRKALLRAAGKAGIDRRVYHHLLRHNFGTHAAASGMNLRAVQEMMGHSTIKTTEIYTHMAPYLQDEAAKLQKFLTKSTVGKKKKRK